MVCILHVFTKLDTAIKPMSYSAIFDINSVLKGHKKQGQLNIHVLRPGLSLCVGHFLKKDENRPMSQFGRFLRILK